MTFFGCLEGWLILVIFWMFLVDFEAVFGGFGWVEVGDCVVCLLFGF